jgi:polysaccharide pyruvyl transferase WcaK-like protein
LAHLGQALGQFQQITQTSVLLVPFQASKDLAIAHQLAQYLQAPHQVLSITHPQQLKGLFQDIDWTLGMRFHALIMAAAEGSRCFAISYDPKVSQLMAALDLPGWELTAQPIAQGYGQAANWHWPTSTQEMVQQWLADYSQHDSQQDSQRNYPTRIRETPIELALTHQRLLQQTLAPISIQKLG